MMSPHRFDIGADRLVGGVYGRLRRQLEVLSRGLIAQARDRYLSESSYCEFDLSLTGRRRIEERHCASKGLNLFFLSEELIWRVSLIRLTWGITKQTPPHPEIGGVSSYASRQGCPLRTLDDTYAT